MIPFSYFTLRLFQFWTNNLFIFEFRKCCEKNLPNNVFRKIFQNISNICFIVAGCESKENCCCQELFFSRVLRIISFQVIFFIFFFMRP